MTKRKEQDEGMAGVGKARTFSFHRTFAVDTDAVENGVWMETEAGGPELRIARYEGPRMARNLRDIIKALQRRYRGRVMPTEESIEVQKEMCIRGLVTDWRKVEDEAGNPAPFSADALREALTHPESGDELARWIVAVSKNRANYQLLDGDDGGN